MKKDGIHLHNLMEHRDETRDWFHCLICEIRLPTEGEHSCSGFLKLQKKLQKEGKK